MKRYLPSLIAFAVSLALLAVAVFLPESRALAVAGALSAVVGVYQLPADFVALLIFRMGGVARGRGMAGEVEAGDAKQIMVELKRLGDESRVAKEKVQEIAVKAAEEAKAAGEMSKATAEKADKLLMEQGAILSELTQKFDKFGEMQTRGEAEKSSGQIFIESPQYKEFMAAGGFKAKGQSVTVSMKTISGLTDAAGGVLVAPDRRPGIIYPPNRRMTVRDLLAPGRTSSNLVEFFRELLFTNSANVVSETTLKPESDLTFEAASAKVTTIAHWIPASKQIMADAPGLQSYVDARMRYGLDFKEEQQLLNGSGVGENLLGLYTAATAFALPSGATAPAQRLDRLRAAILQAELAEFPVDGIVVNPVDGYNLEVMKTTDGAYLFTNPVGTNDFRIWGRRTVQTQAMAQNTALVGAFQTAAQIFDREDASVTISSEDRDNFIRNMLTVLAELRLALAIYRPQALVKIADLDG